MIVSGYSSTSTSLAASLASSRCFLKPLVTGSTMRGSKMALKISLSPSMATKWQPILRQAWTKAPSGNQGRCKQRSQNKKWQGHEERLTRNYIPMDAVQSRTMLPTCMVDSMSNWRRRGSFSLLLQGVLPLMS
jgi:hypothetical protein